MKDLVVLVADKNMEYAVQGLLNRHQALDIRPITQDIFVHPHRDPGCLNKAHHFLRPLAGQYAYALVLFDHEGCGLETAAPEQLADRVESELARNGWPDRSRVVVLVPELETWVWTDSPHVADFLGWRDSTASLRTWLDEQGFWPPDAPKPPRPKEAMEAVLHHVRKPRSSAIYLQLARQVSLRGHSESAFARFAEALRKWFPPTATP